MKFSLGEIARGGQDMVGAGSVSRRPETLCVALGRPGAGECVCWGQLRRAFPLHPLVQTRGPVG